MRAPGWWWRDPARPGALARGLAPLGWAFAAATARRLRRGARWRAGVPVICLGNLEAGGAGKTPMVLALAARLAAAGVAVHVVSRGHGGSLGGPPGGPVRVAPAHTAAQVGDEPLLIAALHPAWVARDRRAGAAAAAAGAAAILFDDGFQDPSVAHDLSIVVVDAARGWGNGRTIPAGPLREGVAAGLSRADLVLTVGDAAAQARFDAGWGAAVGDLPRLRGALAVLPTGMPWAGLRALAFAGIGEPQRFFATLRAQGAEVVEALPLADHQPLPPALVGRIAARAGALGAQMVTTEKDAARLPPDWRARVLTLPVRLQVEDWGPLDARLAALGLPQPASS